MLDKIRIISNSKFPKYLQLANAVSSYIQNEETAIAERLPSVKQFSQSLGLSRETVFKALNILTEKGIIVSFDRRGYYISKVDVELDYRVFFMLDKMTSFKEKTYTGLRKGLGKSAEVDVYFHHGNLKIFTSLIEENLASHTHFVITTFLKEDVSSILNKIPSQKLIVIDKFEQSLTNLHSQVYQDFETDIYESLKEAKILLNKYQNLTLAAPLHAPHRLPIINGFVKFCTESECDYTIIEQDGIEKISKGTAFILIGSKDDDLVRLIKFCRKKNYQLGTEIGVISYNDTQMKEILEGGITVISTDFEQMGSRVAEIILGRETISEKNPSQIIIRKSL